MLFCSEVIQKCGHYMHLYEYCQVSHGVRLFISIASPTSWSNTVMLQNEPQR